MKIERMNVRRTSSGTWERYLQTVYEVKLNGNALQVDGKQLPIEYKASWAVYPTKKRILSCYEPAEFFRHFIEDESWRHSCITYGVLDHIREHGKPA